MTDLSPFLDRLASGLPDTAPPVGLAAAGAGLRRRRRRRAVLGAAAAVVLLVGGTAAGTSLVGDDRADAPAPAEHADDLPFPAPPAGMRWVGLDSVVVAVPVDWEAGESACSGRSTYVGPASSGDLCLVDPPDIRVELSHGEPRDAGRTVCYTSQPPTCVGSMVIDGVLVKVVARSELEVDTVVGSIMRLPDGWTTVPFTGVARSRAQIYEAAGLEVVIAGRLPATVPVAASPGQGEPIEEGGTVTLSPGTEPPAEGIVAEPSIVAPGQDLGVLFPGEDIRGARFTLTTDDGGGYQLITGVEPQWYDLDEEAPVLAFGVGGPGPDELVVPDTAAPGPYRLCADNDLCTTLTVVDP